MFKNTRIKKLLGLTAAIVTIFITINILITYTQAEKAKTLFEQRDSEVLLDIFDFLEVEKDILKVQFQLTDISATRAHKGYDSGFEESKHYYASANKTLDNLISRFKQRNQQVRVDELKQLKKDFTKFYALGVRMAKTYIKYGPVQGNKLMNGFVSHSKKLINKLDSLIKVKKDFDKKLAKEIDDKIFFLEEIVAALGIFLLIFVLFIFRLLSKRINNSLLNLENGLLSFFSFINRDKNTIQLLDDKSKDEFGSMAKIININIEKTKNTLDEDEKLIESAKATIKRVKNGWYSDLIEASTSNKALEDFKNEVNEMITATKQHFINVNNLLEQYVNNDYRNDLSLDNIETGGVFNILIDDINKLKNTITTSLIENKSNGLVLQSSANTLLSNVDTLSKSSTEAAASLEETAAALEEITSNITSNTENVVNMASYANELSLSASDGEKLAKETTGSMEEINKEVTAINEAITVIDQIAFQTNILSLNAAVEAATAGEAGKGFAVVAQEVRNLASRSAEAAKEIKDLVESATNKANNGKSIADKMITGYNGLNSNISKTIELIQDVETSTKEQQIGIVQVNDAINSLDQQTQQNASVAIEAKEIALKTQGIAIEIVEEVNKKEFSGKDSIKEKEIKVNTPRTFEKVEEKVTQPSVSTYRPRTTQKPVMEKKVITSNISDDEWESF